MFFPACLLQLDLPFSRHARLCRHALNVELQLLVFPPLFPRQLVSTNLLGFDFALYCHCFRIVELFEDLFCANFYPNILDCIL